MQNATNRQILRPIDLRFLDQLFLSSPGYVLDFTNPTFGEFFTGELGVNIFSEKYAVPGLPSTSKGKRLRRFLGAGAGARRRPRPSRVVGVS